MSDQDKTGSHNLGQSVEDHEHGIRFLDDEGRCLACCYAVHLDEIATLQSELAEARKENAVLVNLKHDDYATLLQHSRAVSEELRQEASRLREVVKRLEGPFDGTEGLDSFTLATVIGWFEALSPKETDA